MLMLVGIVNDTFSLQKSHTDPISISSTLCFNKVIVTVNFVILFVGDFDEKNHIPRTVHALV